MSVGYDDIRHRVMKVLANALSVPAGGTPISGCTQADVTSTTEVPIIADADIPAGKHLYIQKIHITNHTASETPMIAIQSITSETVVAAASMDGISNHTMDFGVHGLKVPDAGEGVEAFADSAVGDCRVTVVGYYL